MRSFPSVRDVDNVQLPVSPRKDSTFAQHPMGCRADAVFNTLPAEGQSWAALYIKNRDSTNTALDIRVELNPHLYPQTEEERIRGNSRCFEADVTSNTSNLFSVRSAAMNTPSEASET
jgi:hypothetical protein